MRRWVFQLLAIAVLMGFAATSFGADRAGAWREVEKAVNDGLPKTAVEKLQPIIADAIAGKRYGEAAKALCRKIVLEGNIEGNKPEEKILRLEKELPGMDASIRPLLRTVLARWYRHYFQQNNWRFLQRTQTAGLDEKDFTTWDLPKLFGKIGSLYDEVLKEEAALKTVKLEELSDFLEAGNQPLELRPTLYDFIVHDALDFYCSGEQAGAHPEDAFDMTVDSPVLSETKTFLAWRPDTGDISSPKLKAITLFQKLLAFHSAAGNRKAFFDADLRRLRWAKEAAVGEGSGNRYLEQLQSLAKEYSDLALSAIAMGWAAEELRAQGKTTEAHALASQGLKKFPGSEGSSFCQSVIVQLENRELTIHCERVAGTPLPTIRVGYRNIDQVHFRLVSIDWTDTLKKTNYSPDQIDWEERNRLLKRTPAHSWTVSLPGTPDFKTRTESTDFPSVKPGPYFLIGSWKDDFSKRENALRCTLVWVSSLALVPFSREGEIGGFLLDNQTGEPIADAEVEGMMFQYDKGWRRASHVRTDKDGRYRFSRKGDQGEGLLAVAHIRGETLIDTEMLNSYNPGKPDPYEEVFFFTDRALYRPGQTIQFKGLAVRVDQEGGSYKILPNRPLTIGFQDPNGQEIEKGEFKTNAFGSFSGSFTAPGAGRLLGQMTLSVISGGMNGNAILRVEEYKRPKFKVTLEPPADGGKLGEQMTLTGEAMGYSGAPIDGSLVKYRVTREVQMPWWCWWYHPPQSGAREITHGTAKTDEQGKFKITFRAHPDLAVPEKEQPTFRFRVSADVTDSNGETRSAAASLRVGYTALEMNLSADSWLESGKTFPIRIQTATLDGKGVPAHGTLRIHGLKSPKTPVRKSLGSEPTKDLSDPKSWETDQLVTESTFDTGVDGTASSSVTLQTGVYRVIATTRDRFGKEVSSQLELKVVDPTATTLAIKIPHLFFQQRTQVEVGESYKALWGTGYDTGRAFIEVEHRGTLVSAFWTKPGVTQHQIEVPVTPEMRGGFQVRVTQVRENRAYLQQQYVDVPYRDRELGLSFSHFSSKLQPGQKDTWTISIKGPGAEMKAVELVAGMYDASLDAFAPHGWLSQFDFFRRDRSSYSTHFANREHPLDTLEDSWNRGWSTPHRAYHHFPGDIIHNFYGYEFDSEQFADGLAGGAAPSPRRRMKMMAPPAPMMSVTAQSNSRGMAESKAKSLAFDEESPSAEPAPAPTDQRSAPTAGKAGEPDLSKVSARTNLNETAFFFPHLSVEKDGTVNLTFTVPEALTTWKFLGFAHGMNCESGGMTGETVTQKDLMVQPNPPRFLREGDTLEFSAKITNLSDKVQKGKIRLSLRDPASDIARDADFGLKTTDLPFEIPAKQSKGFSWPLIVPDGPGVVVYKVVAAAEALSDGEEAMLPILSRRILVTESLPLPIRGPGSKTFSFEKLLGSAASKTLVSESLTLQMTSNPAWYAVQALPYLMEYPHECSEQLFNRLYANSLARFIALSDPKIKRVFETWKTEESQGGKALLSNLEKNQELKSVLLLETPWVCEAKSETAQKHNIGVLFDTNRLESELARGMDKLGKMQAEGGYWPWFPGGPPNSFITLYVVTGFGRLRHLGVDIEVGMAVKALRHLDLWIDKTYRDILKYSKPEDNHLSETIALYLYGRSFFLKDQAVAPQAKEAVDYFLGQAAKYWLKLDNRLSQGHLALGLKRFGEKVTPQKIFASIKERSVTNEELGRFWRDTELSYWWYRAPIETQAIMIELFDEVGADPAGVEDCKVWLLKQKQTQNWKTTKATADAIYALLLKGADLLASDKLVKVSLGGQEIKPEKVEAGTGFYEKRFTGPEVKPAMGEIKVTKEDQGVAWGGLHWQYLEDMSKVTPHETNLKLKKTLFIKRDSPKGPVIMPVQGKLSVGDLLVVRVELRSDRDMEFIHMKDGRGSGLEPVDVLSGYRYQDGLGYYHSTKDSASHFYFDYLPKGTYVFEYNLRVQHRGKYQTGMAEIQCMYAPEFNSHSESFWLEVE